MSLFSSYSLRSKGMKQKNNQETEIVNAFPLKYYNTALLTAHIGFMFIFYMKDS